MDAHNTRPPAHTHGHMCTHYLFKVCEGKVYEEVRLERPRGGSLKHDRGLLHPLFPALDILRQQEINNTQQHVESTSTLQTMQQHVESTSTSQIMQQQIESTSTS